MKFTASLLASTAFAVFNKEFAINQGGIGSPADKILYELINEETIDADSGYSLTLQLYYKTREKRELHGNLLLTTKDLGDNHNIKFGWLFTDDQDKGHYDGLYVETEYFSELIEDEEGHGSDFRGFDVWTELRPDPIDNDVNVLELPLDRRQDFNLNPVKCFKKCTPDGVCQFNAHFWRYFDSGDYWTDYVLDENEDKTFYVLGYYQAHSLEGSQKRTASGLSDDIMVKIGRIKDYE